MNRATITLLVAGLCALFCFSVYLSVHRIYQVDECQNVYMAGVLASRAQQAFYTDASAFNLALSSLAGGNRNSGEFFASARLAMLGIFWLNIFLLALNTGQRLSSSRGLLALFSAATLAPMWDYGIEIRHDNVLLAGLLVSWYLLRVRPGGAAAYAVAGAVAGVAQLAVFKAFAYLIPFSLCFLFWPPRGHKERRWRLYMAWAAGLLCALSLARLTYGALGLWKVYMADLRGYAAASLATARFLPLETLASLPRQAPLLLCLLAAGVIRAFRGLRRRGKAAPSWDSSLPEGGLFCGAFIVLVINPTPYPYNLLNLVPYGFLLAFRSAEDIVKDIQSRPQLIPFAWSIFIFAHLAPFCIATARHLEWTNARQRQLMSLSESLTDPSADAVYDAIGMVPSRPSISYHWYIQSLNKSKFTDGTWPPVRDMLARNPAAVLIPSYRTDWLSQEDHDFVGRHYVALSDDFWVLGQVLPARGGAFEIIHSGRYRLSCLKGSDLPGAPEGGASAAAVELAVGPHEIKTKDDCHPTVVWVGPSLDRIGPLAQADHRSLFVNWY